MLQINVLKRMHVFRKVVSISVKSKESLEFIHRSRRVAAILELSGGSPSCICCYAMEEGG